MVPRIAALIVAAGRGLRSGPGLPKQYRSIGGQPVLRASLTRFAEHPRISLVQPVIHPDDEERFAGSASGLRLLPPVHGGATRQASVLAGLLALEGQAPDIVLVHDAARPFVSAALIDRAIAAATAHRAAVPALPVTDTIKAVDQDRRIAGTVERVPLRSVQTPQAFDYPTLLDAHRKAEAAGLDHFTDDAAILEWAGIAVSTFAGEASNVKLTSPEDFIQAQSRFEAMFETRTGFGFDVHAFGPGDHIMLAGVAIPHDRALTGHSDADVVLHAAVDALLGALADGDIGSHFPPSDPQWRGAASDIFFKFAVERVAARGGRIMHLDVTIVCEAPKIGPHRDRLRARIAELAGIAIDRVAVKATTSEGLGFTGRREGIAAYVTASVRLPWSESDAG